MKARAERFGILTKEIKDERIKNRQKRFGIETSESKLEKIEQRKARFAAQDAAEVAEAVINDPELLKKMEARAERFGKVDEDDMHRKKFQKGGFLGKRNRSFSKKGGNKRFKGRY